MKKLGLVCCIVGLVSQTSFAGDLRIELGYESSGTNKDGIDVTFRGGYLTFDSFLYEGLFLSSSYSLTSLNLLGLIDVKLRRFEGALGYEFPFPDSNTSVNAKFGVNSFRMSVEAFGVESESEERTGFGSQAGVRHTFSNGVGFNFDVSCRNVGEGNLLGFNIGTSYRF